MTRSKTTLQGGWWRAMFLVVWGMSMSAAIAGEPKTWHLLITTYGGKVSLLRGLTKHEAEFSRARLLGLPATAEEQRAADKVWLETNPPCPGKDGNATKVEWAEWRKRHPLATGCTYSNGGTSWGGFRSISDGDVKSVEMFQ